MKKHHIKINILFLLCILIWTGSFVINVRGEEAETIKVGFFHTPGFSERSPSGAVTGYQIDYIKKLSDYTGWNYEFVEVKNFLDASNRLINGDIDILAPVIKTENYKGRFLFSENTMGTQYGSLLTKEDNHGLTFANYESLNMLKIGYVDQTGVSNNFFNFAKAKEFEPDYIEYDTTAELLQALEEDQIQAAVADLSWSLNSLKVLAEFTPTPVYFVTNLTNYELMDTINEAIGWLKLEEPFYENNLAEKYFGEFEGIPLTQEENAYIQKAPIWRIGYMTGLDPLSYEKQKKGAGILVDILKMIQKNTGLYFELVPINADIIDKETIESLKLDLVLGVKKNARFQNMDHIKFTNPIYDSIHVFVGKKGTQMKQDEAFKVAVCKAEEELEVELLKVFPKIIVVPYATPAECMNAVRTGEVKVMLQNQQVVKYHLGRPVYDNLEILPQAILEEELSIAIVTGHQSEQRLKSVENPQLINVLNKGIKQIEDADIEMCVLANSVGLPSILNAEDIIYTYKNLIPIMVIILIIGGLVGLRIWKTYSNNMKRIRKNEKELSYLTHNINGGVIALKANESLTIDFINNGLIRMLNMDERATKNLLGGSFFALVHVEDRDQLKHLESNESKVGYDFSKEIRIKTSDGKFIPIILQGNLSKEKGQEEIYYCVALDIREQKAMITKLSEERERFSMVLEQSEDIIFDVNLKRGKINFSNKFEEIFGTENKWKGAESNHDNEHVYEDDLPVLQSISRQVSQGAEKICERIRLRNKEGSYTWCEIRMGCVKREGVAVRVIGKITDIDERVREKERLEQKNKLDLMTGLLNKATFHLGVEAYLKNPGEIRGALLFIDLDNFKTLNDTLGHMTGDIALKAIGGIISEIYRKADFLARFGGDEFVIFSPGIDKEVFCQRAETLREKLIQTYFSEDKSVEVTISASMGYIYVDGTIRDYNVLMERADKALYSAKVHGKNRVVEYSRMIETENTPLMQALLD